ncbi:lipase family protein [Sediminitomix flava]|uniref:Pimeloyl-ACP methyl ester carboxylesterase n=1 Tax=Sediminitomix flava TaxID=379075 RepID=A0A315ZCD1_SEDFL|nr:lipase family protein [Sediminitomix flava]PWJ42478.1 pimeloyl-ACP methyl ester carboxylesterase [Sediminitomix flava]
MKNLILPLLLSSFVFFSSCSDDDDSNSAPSTQTLISLEDKNEASQQQVIQLISLAFDDSLSTMFTKGFKSFRVTYYSDYENERVRMSGVLTLPSDYQTTDYPLMMVHRGTTVEHLLAPTELTVPLYDIFAGLEFISFTPDLLGLGSSKAYPQAYYHAEYTAQASIDMYKAVKEALAQMEVSYQDQLYILGYSQGGYSAMATLKYIEDHNLNIDVVATAAGAGGYDLTETMTNIVQGDIYESPILISMPILTYNRLGNKADLSAYFQEKYALILPNLVDGARSMSDLNNALNDTLSEFFNEDFLLDLREKQNISFIEGQLIENSVHDWLPKSPVYLLHHKDDQTVPYESSQTAYAKMKSLGATEIELIELSEYSNLSGRNIHGNAAYHSMFESIQIFKKYRK